ncbi:MAG TPA: adenylate/guanylate cyclase domain-containing protein [Pyrinomonadaceae bacterium]|jgi:WD40 repeat protein/class 3 adenylate cyclase/DNA-directed RNA polymerase subunit RPC12/RpoP
MSEEANPNQIPAGFTLRHTLGGNNDVFMHLAWSPDGQTIAAGSSDGTVRLWDAETGRLRRTFYLNSGRIAWSPDGRMFAAGSAGSNDINLWDIETGQQRLHIRTAHLNSDCVVWSPDGTMLAAGSNYGTVRLWSAKTGYLLRPPSERPDRVNSIAWSPDGQTLAAQNDKGLIRLRDADTGQLRYTLQGSFAPDSIAWSPDGQTLAAGSFDGTVQMWDAATGQRLISIEGHTDYVISVAFSSTGDILASKSMDNTIRLWRCDTGDNVAVLDEPSFYEASGLAFHPHAPVLATLSEKNRVLRIWDLDFAVILAAPSVAPSISYTNAKVVLVGDTGVGKTGLGVRLAEGVWRPTPGSTHGMNVWPLYSEPEREVMLWDFAGQDEYRLTHQLFMNETNVALLLYDPTKSQDTFFGIDYWEKALRNTVAGEVQKLLVAARVDAGGVRMTEDDIAAYCRAHGYLAHFTTSAETNEGCDELRAAIMAAIPWEQLPRTRSPEVFKRIKDFLTTVRQGNRILVRQPDLRAEFDAAAGVEGAPTEDEFRTVIGHVEIAGLIKRLSFGDFVLLKPELLNGYAADIVDAARRHTDGLGAVRKGDVLDGRIKLKDEGGLKQSDKIFLLHATVELFLRLGLALEQDGNLVFPSKFNRRMPPLEADPVIQVEFDFEGQVENLYTTLVVKLYYGGIFKLKRLWKNAAEFLAPSKPVRVCGFQLHSEGDGRGTLKVFYADGVSDDHKALFLKIIADHFNDKGVAVRPRGIYRCPHCGELVQDRRVIEIKLARGETQMRCQYCDEKFPLRDALQMLYRDEQRFHSQIEEIKNRAEAHMERGGELVAASAELRTENFKTWAGGADIATVAVVFTDVVDSTKLNVESGDERWRQVREAHFARTQELIRHGHGYLIKNKGDGVMAAFHSASDALDFALALNRDAGHELVKIRAGIHIGPVEVNAGDAFGQHVNMAARVEAHAKGAGIRVSMKVKEDVDSLRAARHKKLKWIEHTDQELKGFPQKYTLWSVAE